MKNTVKHLAVAGALAGALLASVGCGKEKEPAKNSPEVVRNVETITVQRAALPSYYEAVGTVRALQSAQVSAQVMGTILRMNVREGDRVSRGQALAVVDDSQTRAGLDRALASQRAALQEISAANTEFVLAESTLKRYQMLQEKKSVSPHEFEEVSARYEAAKARREMAQAGSAGAGAGVEQARSAQGFTQIRAPFAGVITAKLAEAGNLAAPGTPLLTLEDTGNFRLEVAVDESNIADVHSGATVPVSIDALRDKLLDGRVVQVLPGADASSRSFLVKIGLPKDPLIRSGLFGRARFPSGTREGFSIPQTAVVRRGSMQAVYAIGPDQIANLRYVTLGQVVASRFEVLSGLDSGERIVVDPGGRELNGKKIEVR